MAYVTPGWTRWCDLWCECDLCRTYSPVTPSLRPHCCLLSPSTLPRPSPHAHASPCSYATTFDASLDGLQYRVPGIVAEKLLLHKPPKGRGWLVVGNRLSCVPTRIASVFITTHFKRAGSRRGSDHAPDHTPTTPPCRPARTAPPFHSRARFLVCRRGPLWSC